jgi:hypothetical protein
MYPETECGKEKERDKKKCYFVWSRPSDSWRSTNEDVWSISSAEQHLSGRDTHFQTTLNNMKEHMPKKAPIQSTFPDLSTHDSGGNANHNDVKRTAPRIALDESQFGSVTNGRQAPTLKRRTISIPRTL